MVYVTLAWFSRSKLAVRVEVQDAKSLRKRREKTALRGQCEKTLEAQPDQTTRWSPSNGIVRANAQSRTWSAGGRGRGGLLMAACGVIALPQSCDCGEETR